MKTLLVLKLQQAKHSLMLLNQAKQSVSPQTNPAQLLLVAGCATTWMRAAVQAQMSSVTRLRTFASWSRK